MPKFYNCRNNFSTTVFGIFLHMLESKPMALGKQIKHYREKAGITMERLEQLSGVDGGTIGALEVRDSKRSQYANQLAKAFGLTVEQLSDEKNSYYVNLTDTTKSTLIEPTSTLQYQLANRLATADPATLRLIELALYENDEEAAAKLTPSLVAMVRGLKAVIEAQGGGH